ncbi:heme-dependent peroxidase [Aciduricibacillus chroicocephali]|uniref:Coproheme decarboxylase n=1 Tax=Aciduricibacillus chroicocephali TaxID=3054939 RepID=A0ABY9KX16_9BACI|nr:heme-dependent peroxidase [Bacillaceae bacterium 44XB]
MAEQAVETMDGWYCLHDFRNIDWPAWKQAAPEERAEAIGELKELLAKWEAVEEKKEGSHAFYQIVGQKADIMFMLLRPTMNELGNFETELAKSKIGDYLLPAYSYVSVVELSKYRAYEEEHPEENPHVKARLQPILPKWEHMCFYPMDKRRGDQHNWYDTDFKKRAGLLYEHSKTGRKYSGKVSQIISGSFGFDDWEWGVTLFAHDVINLKKIVYEMRFDEASAHYAEFGEFLVGNILDKESVTSYLEV